MYYIYAIVDGVTYPIHNPKASVLITGDPYFKVGDNVNGQAEFTIYPDHPYYDKVKKLTTDIEFYKDDATEPEFAGRVLYDDEDISGTKEVFVEGELAFLCDSIQRPKVYHNVTVEDYFKDILENHNLQVEERKQFQPGRVTVTDSNDSLYRYSNWETTREILSSKLIDTLGGHLVIRRENGVRYLDYLSDDDYYVKAEQTISFGKNLLDFARNIDASDIATCIIPLGAKLDEDEQDESLEAIGDDQRLTIEAINGGVDYVTDDNAVATYGKIFKTVIWDDVTVASNLKKKAEEYLKSVQYENMTLEVKAIDLSLTSDDYDSFCVRNKIRCISTPNGLDSWFPVAEMAVYITKFSKDTLTLGNVSTHSTYTSSNNQASADLEKTVEELPSKSEILEQAIKDAQELINAQVASGYAIHEPNEFIVADDPDYKNTAQNLWRWGLGGLGHYSEGYDGPLDGIALTMDGKINGKMLLVGSVYAESIDIGYRTEVETTISEAETAAKDYADSSVKTAKQTIETEISNLEDRINLSVSSAKEIVLRKNYVANGEQETLDLASFTVSGDYATVEEAEFLNLNCLKLTFTATGIVNITQSVGTLPAGNYTVSVETAFPSGAAAATYRPTYIAYGFSNSRTTAYYSSYTADEFHSFKKTVSITESSKTVSIGIYGTAGKVCYITNIRCLRDIQELLDDLDAKLTLEVGKVQAAVTDVYENVQHDYCVNGDFSDADDSFDGWSKSNESYVASATYSSESAAKITNPSSAKHYIYQGIKVHKTGPFKVRFKAACASGYESTARIRCLFAGTSQYTTAGQLTTSWQTFEFDFSGVSAGTKYLYLYNYVYSTAVYITDVEILGYMSAYSEAMLTVLQDSITAEVTRASGAESTLAASIQVNATNITSCVTKDDVGSYITQYYSNVIVAFNNNSKYVQFNAGNIEIYDASKTSSKLRARFDQDGEHFWRDGYYVGKIGTNQWQSNTYHKGLVFDLEANGKYMAWAYKPSSSSSYYQAALTFSRANSLYDDIGLHLGCNLDCHWYTLKNVDIENVTSSGYVPSDVEDVEIITGLYFDSTGYCCGYQHTKLRFFNGICCGVWLDDDQPAPVVDQPDPRQLT